MDCLGQEFTQGRPNVSFSALGPLLERVRYLGVAQTDGGLDNLEGFHSHANWAIGKTWLSGIKCGFPLWASSQLGGLGVFGSLA